MNRYENMWEALAYSKSPKNKDADMQNHLRQDTKRRMKAYHQEHGKLDWKDYLYIIPAFLLLAVIIGSAVINL